VIAVNTASSIPNEVTSALRPVQLSHQSHVRLLIICIRRPLRVGMTEISESARTWEIERGTLLRRSTQGEVISESPVHVETMRSDSRRTLASHGHGGSESTTPWDDEHRTSNAQH
jgi:hypothetical protein